MSSPAPSHGSQLAWAEALFLRYHPDHRHWFAAACQSIAAQQAKTHHTCQLEARLPATAASDPAAEQLARHFGLFFELFSERFPCAATDLYRRLVSLCRRHGLSEEFMHGLWQNCRTVARERGADLPSEAVQPLPPVKSLRAAEAELAQLKYPLHRLIKTRSPTMVQPLKQLVRCIELAYPLVVRGETGTGKELVAKAVWQLGCRSAKPFVAVNCAAIPPTLIESELFGSCEGAYFGASERPGYFEQAQGGVLFLDEIGDLPVNCHPPLFRILAERQVCRCGGRLHTKSDNLDQGSADHRSIPLDVWLLFATDANLEEQVKRGDFRKQLYHRMEGLPITLPPLRERPEDVAVLARHFLTRTRDRFSTVATGFADDCLRAMERYAWPGNGRELRKVVGNMAALATGPELSLADLRQADMSIAELHRPQSDSLPAKPNWPTRETLQSLLQRHRHLPQPEKRDAVCAELGVKRATFYRMCREYGLRPSEVD